jgi:hypothetical protein
MTRSQEVKKSRSQEFRSSGVQELQNGITASGPVNGDEEFDLALTPDSLTP